MDTTVLNKLKEKRKMIIATLCVIAIAVFAFQAGRKAVQPPEPESVQAKSSEEGVPSGTEQDRQRKPASEPKRDHDQDPDLEREAADEEEVQVAHQRTPANPSAEVIAETHAKSERVKDERGLVRKFLDALSKAPRTVHQKILQLHQSEEENRRLRLENARLRVLLETQKFERRVSEVKEHSEQVSEKLAKQTGSEAGRGIASISYQIPENLLPEQLHALALSYLKVQDNERAAAILTFLTEQDADLTYKGPENDLLAGVAWYRLENHRKASEFFERALKDPTASPRVKTQARIWSALVAHRTKDDKAAQEWLRQTLEADPQSREARWVNGERDRKPASEQEAEGEHEGEHREPATHEAGHSAQVSETHTTAKSDSKDHPAPAKEHAPAAHPATDAHGHSSHH